MRRIAVHGRAKAQAENRLDEIGYLFFQLALRRYQDGSNLLTSNQCPTVSG